MEPLRDIISYLSLMTLKFMWLFSVSEGILPHSVCEIWVPGRRTIGKVTSVPKLLAENLPTGKVVNSDTFTEHPVPHALSPTQTHAFPLSCSPPNTAQKEPLINQFLKSLRKSFDPACCHSLWMAWIDSMVSSPQIMPPHKCLVD